MSLCPAPAIFSRSNAISSSPALTLSPGFTKALKPSPFISTVSSPMCNSSSMPLSRTSPQACRLSSMTTATMASAGALKTPSSGLMATPSPSALDANTWSGISSMGITSPDTYAFNSLIGWLAESFPSSRLASWPASLRFSRLASFWFSRPPPIPFFLPMA